MKAKDLKELLEQFNNVVKVEPLRPVTSFIEMFCTNGVFRIGCTNGYIKVVGTLLDDRELGNVVLDRTQLLKLLKLTTKENITLTKKDSYVEFKGNGKYKLVIQKDELGGDITLNLAMPKLENGIYYEIEEIKDIFNRNSIAVFDGDDHEQFKQYYSSDGIVVTTDSNVVCTTNGTLPAKGMSKYLMQMISKLPNNFSFAQVEQGVRINCEDMEIYVMQDAIDEFPIEMVSPFCSTSIFDSKITIDKSELMQAIKRQDLFIKSWQNHACLLTLEDNHAIITNEDKNVEEDIECTVEGNKYSRLVFSTTKALSILRTLNPTITLYACDKCLGFQDSQSLYVLSLINSPHS